MSYLPNHEVTFVPLRRWPGVATARRKSAPFRKAWRGVLDVLDHELLQLSAKRVVVEVTLDQSRIRLDGAPRAGAVIDDPRVILSFDSRHGPQRYPADRFDDWRDNLYAIALSLEALRRVDRYGVTKRGEQYRGFAELPAPDAGPFTNASQAEQFLRDLVGDGLAGDTHPREVYRAAQVKAHPDRPGGSHKLFLRVTAAGRLLGVA